MSVWRRMNLRSGNVQRVCLASLISVGVLARPAQADSVYVSGPVGPVIDVKTKGSGLCIASSVSTQSGIEFALDESDYRNGINAFMEAQQANRDEHVVRSALDLSNHHTPVTSNGDFVGFTPCANKGGCDFFDDDDVAFASRLRAFLNVTDDLVNQDIHVGFYVDDAVSLTIFDNDGDRYPVVIRPPVLGAPTWRLTDSVVFEQPGLYPVEILYVQFVEDAALEMSYFVGKRADFERAATEKPIIKLNDVGFVLFPADAFYHTVTGTPSFPDIDTCRQCDRDVVDQPDAEHDCGTGHYCNQAALCAPCDNDDFCGPGCTPCTEDMPFCLAPDGGDYQCFECRTDEDCEQRYMMNGYLCHPENRTCGECLTDEHCERGDYCDNQTCTPCSSNERCAGNSCNCCPDSDDGTPRQCAPVDPGGPPVCMECASDADCATGICDVQIGRCVQQQARNERADCCGSDCVSCPSDHPFCLPGPLGTACAQCRWDTDCDDGAFCQSGVCLPCNTDRHCGTRCERCAGDTPFCRSALTPALSICVGCEHDAQCPRGDCNPTTNQCDPPCTLSCAGDTPYCADDQCLECLADTHCACNGTCDPERYTCSSSCVSNADCSGYEHCAWNDDFDDKRCVLGPQVGQSPCTGLSSCITPFSCEISVSHRRAKNANSAPIWALVAVFGLLAIRRRRGYP